MATESQIFANRQDYVRPEERDLYTEFCETLYTELSPEGLLEQSFVSEITGATWRLRRCAAAEADLADYDESTEKTRRSIERARAHAHNLLHRSVNQLRRLQTERACRLVLNADGDDAGLADYRQVVIAANNLRRGKDLAFNAALASICKTPTGHSAKAELASICKTPEPSEIEEHLGPVESVLTPRNAPPILTEAA